ncbi:MAG: hypothetical protein P1P89_22215 [Desulfobacterales bacterium]|nr:hypothetical protein [Desulfobacterales bacterium]
MAGITRLIAETVLPWILVVVLGTMLFSMFCSALVDVSDNRAEAVRSMAQ